MKPYIGVTGFTDVAQIGACLGEFTDNGPAPTYHQLMVGVLVSHKTLKGEQSKFPKRYPSIEEISKLFIDSKDVLNLVHFNTHSENFVPELEKVIQLGGDNLHGFQLNMCWPSIEQLNQFRSRDNAQVIVLQIGSGAFKEVSYDPKKLNKKLWGYKDLVDYILLDTSGGLGKAMDPQLMREFLYEIYGYGYHRNFGVGIAGGISHENIAKLGKLFCEFPELSIDAEGRLRNPDDDTMNIYNTQLYLRAAKICLNQ